MRARGTEVRPAASTAGGRRPGAVLAAGLAAHGLFALMVVAAIALRLEYAVAFPRIFLVAPDSVDYLRAAATWTPNDIRPFGYSALLAALRPTGNLSAVTAVQHVAGPALAGAVYGCLYRRGVRGWLAALAAAPVLFDAWQLSLEHYVMAETLFGVLCVGAVLVLIRPGRPSAGTAAAAGVLLAAAGLTRTVGAPLGVLAAGYLLNRRSGWRPAAFFAAAFAAPMAAYVMWFHHSYGVYGFTRNPSLVLYGRMAQVADCDRLPELTARERRLCPAEPLGHRHAADWYWLVGADRPALRFAPDDPVFAGFDHKVLRAQFPAVARQWAKETSFFFRVAAPDERAICLNRLWVPVPGKPVPLPWCYPHPATTGSFDASLDLAATRTAPADSRVARARTYLERYLALARTPPVALAAAVVVTLLGSLRVPLAARPRCRRTRRLPGRARRLRWVPALPRAPGLLRIRGADGRDALFSLAVGGALLGLAVAGSMFDIRYALPALPMLGIGAALAGNQLLGPRGPARATGPSRQRVRGQHSPAGHERHGGDAEAEVQHGGGERAHGEG